MTEPLDVGGLVRVREPLWVRLFGLVVVVGILAAIGASFVRVPYAVLSPGPITNVLGTDKSGKPLIDVKGTPTYATSGVLDFTTVSVKGGPGHEVSALDYLVARFNSSDAIYPVDEIFPKGASEKEVEAENTALMTDSQQEAIAIALTKQGLKVVQKLIIGGFGEGSPAQAAGLAENDVITALDGHPVTGDDSLRTYMATVKPGATVQVTVRRGSSDVTKRVVTRNYEGHALIGVLLRLDFTFPYDVKIDAGKVGGPSAGLMMALGVFDKMTPGELTGGAAIAGTGTITYTGEVGPIGGIRQKLIGARRGGAEWFLAPADNCAEVVGHIPDGLQVVKVSTFDGAIAALTGISVNATSALPSCAGTKPAP